MKRVCIIRHKCYPIAVPTRRNAEALVSRGYEVDIICLRGKGEKSREVIRGVNVYRLPVEHRRGGVARYVSEYAAFFLLAFFKLTWLSLRRRYQVVEVDNMPDFLVFTALIPKLMGAKVIIQILDHSPEVFMDGFGVGSKHPVVRTLRILEKASAGWSDHVIVTQDTSLELLKRLGIPQAKMSVLLNVPDEDIFTSGAPVSGNGHFRLMTHGSIVDRYGLSTLIKAVPLLKETIPDLQVEIVGDGESRQRLEALAKSLGVGETVRFTGRIPMDEVPAHIARADVGVVVIPWGNNPAVPNKLFEYAALGKPAIVTSIAPIKSYFDDDSVMYYEPGSERDLARCILELYRNPEKRASLALNCSAVYQKCRWSLMKEEYYKVFDRLLGACSLS